jgi:hypothetical protein
MTRMRAGTVRSEQQMTIMAKTPSHPHDATLNLPNPRLGVRDGGRIAQDHTQLLSG